MPDSVRLFGAVQTMSGSFTGRRTQGTWLGALLRHEASGQISGECGYNVAPPIENPAISLERLVMGPDTAAVLSVTCLAQENVWTSPAHLCSVDEDLRARGRFAIASGDTFDVVEAVGALANQLGSARTDDHTLPSWKTSVAFPPGIALKGRNEVHESGGVLRTLWGQIKDTQQGVCVLVSLGGQIGRSRKSR